MYCQFLCICPRRSFGKVMFSQVFVCPREGWVSLVPGPFRGSTSRGGYVQGVGIYPTLLTPIGGHRGGYTSYWNAFFVAINDDFSHNSFLDFSNYNCTKLNLRKLHWVTLTKSNLIHEYMLVISSTSCN